MHPGCSALVNGRDSKCPLHMKAQRKREDEQRNKAVHALYGSRWRKARAIHLRANPLCNACFRIGQLVPATIVDHIEPHKGDERLFWQRSNWQSLCKPCHDTKTATEDGGFGRTRDANANVAQNR